MSTSTSGPVWLQGPVQGVPDLLQHVAHALIECDNDVRALLAHLSPDLLWSRPGGAASVGFHVRHSMGSLDRLFTYARGEALTAQQLSVLAEERNLGPNSVAPGQLGPDFSAAVARAVDQLRGTPVDALLHRREVGRAKLPSTVIGLLSHAAEHTYRHVGQAVTTAKVVGR
jgi:hypothetical protein